MWQGKQKSVTATAERACWQGTVKARELALAHAEQQEGEMELDVFCSDKRCDFIEPVQSVLQSSSRRKSWMNVLENAWNEDRVDCKAKAPTT